MSATKTFLKRQPYAPPAWAKELSSPPSERVVLGNFPTPIFPFNPPGLPKDVTMYIKRDDYSGVEISGNKARKLEFLLAEAIAQGADCVVTCGGIQSNHCRATAVSARMLGLDSVLILRADDPTQDPGLVGNLMIDRLVGAELLMVSRRDYAKHGGGDYFIEALYMEYLIINMDQLGNLAQGRKPYGIPVGGSNGTGTWGYIEIIEELEHQVKDLEISVTDVAFACGSGGSAAGIGAGAYLYAKHNAKSSLQFTRPTQVPVHAYIVCDSPKYFYDYIDERILPHMGLKDKSISSHEFLQMTNAMGVGYAKSTKEELDYISQVARDTGVLLDPVYSGKALYMLIKDLNENPSKFQGKSILFVHTGGMFGLYDKVNELSADAIGTVKQFQLE
ncbi:D-cysteine desulfhydrase [Thraustotheca clavata]|uniref:D-cysteine desulfhydrase n=1 Tax=Thraustotheca clavata TaxID=74557 RepID=A0A1V9ZWF3_9STRA|nr:D-cysteine desulfhydrase [Thraustotheca clavata]